MPAPGGQRGRREPDLIRLPTADIATRLPLSDPGGRPPYEPEQEQKNDGADEGDENHPGDPAERRGHSKLRKQPSADKRTDDADDDVADEAVTGTTHHEGREHARDKSYDEPGEQVHLQPPEKRG